MLSLIPNTMVEHMWDQAEPFLAMAIPYAAGECNLEKMKDEAIAGRTLVFLVSNENHEVIAAMSAEVIDYPSGKRVLVMGMVGGTDMGEWIDDVVDKLQQLGKGFGCESAYITGRPGWLRRLSKHGFKTLHHTVEMRL